MPLSFMNDQVTVRRAPMTRKHGAEFRDWSNAKDTTLKNVQVTAQATSRTFEGRVEQVTDRRTLRARYDADIQIGDRILWNGEIYEIDGEVFHTKSPSGRVSSTRCTLVRWEG